MMARQTFVLRDGKFVEKSKAPPLPGVTYMPDIQEFQTIDGHTISSRKQLRDYERAYGVKQVGNDLPPPGRER